jgi:HD superfamily phosphodiesterase
MADTVIQSISRHIIEKLQGLSPRLTYHSLLHTLDVTEQAGRIAAEENIRDETELFLLRTAALYHDTGFLVTYVGHEEAGCDMARSELPGFGLDKPQIEKICKMIMATKIPQSPMSNLDEILADADLDYLGRDDFENISNNLRLEFLEYGIVKNNREWEEKQIAFLESHHFFTKSSKLNRESKKRERLVKLKKKLANKMYL